MINLCDWFEIKFEKNVAKYKEERRSYMKLIVKQN